MDLSFLSWNLLVPIDSPFLYLAIKQPVTGVLLGFASVHAQDGHPYTIMQTTILQNPINPPHTPWQACKMALVVPSFNTQLHTRCSPPPPLTNKNSSVGRALGTAQVLVSFVAPLEYIFKRSSLRFFRDMIIIELYVHLY